MSNAETRKRITEEINSLNTRIQQLYDEMPAEEGCGTPGCFEDAAWVRATQFAGKHYFCETHAKAQRNFGEDDPSYFFWATIADYHAIRKGADEDMKAWLEQEP